ncbi:MAG: GNAT family N-acetyltransferase [Thermomicrobiales bacterium]
MSIVLKRNLVITSDELNRLRRTAWDGPQHGNWDPVFTHSLGWVCATEADRSDRLIGFVNVAWDGDSHAFLLDTTVDREYQRRGIGRDLVLEAAALARERGAEWLHVDYDPELDGFYRSCGFRPTAAGLLNLMMTVSGDER